MQLDLPEGVNSIILLTVLGAVAYRVSSAAERERALQYLRQLLAAFKTVMLERREGLHEFRLAVRARTSRPGRKRHPLMRYAASPRPPLRRSTPTPRYAPPGWA